MRTVLLSLGTTVLLSAPAFAQPARVGRLPLLAPLPAHLSCRITPSNAALRRSGIDRLLTVRDSADSRLVSVGVDADGTPQMLNVMMSTREGRRSEGESAFLVFGNGGSVHGSRRAFTAGTPANLSEDRDVALFPSDTSQARALVRAVRRLCVR